MEYLKISHPAKLRLSIMRFFLKRMNITEAQLEKWAGLLSFELAWWRDRGWLRAKSLKQLAKMPVPEGFTLKSVFSAHNCASLDSSLKECGFETPCIHVEMQGT
jgi:hypothetical protein